MRPRSRTRGLDPRARRLAMGLAAAVVCMWLPRSARAQEMRADTAVAAGKPWMPAGSESILDRGAGADLVEWIDPRTGFASRAAAGCWMVVEARLTSRGASDRLWLHITATDFRRALVDTQGVTARFSSGRSRTLTPVVGDAVVWLRKSVVELFDFPEKDDFHAVTSVSIEVPFLLEGPDGGRCTVSVEFLRNRSQDDARSVDLYGPFALEVGAGVRTTTGSAGLGRLGSGAQLAMDFGFAVFPWVHHGVEFYVAFDSFGLGGASAVLPGNPADSGLEVQGAGIYLGYAFQYVFWKRLSVAYALTPGAYLLELASSDGNNAPKKYGTTLAIRQRLSVAGIFYTEATGWFEIGAALADTVIPFGRFGAVSDISGNSVAGLVSLAMRLGR